MRLVLGGILGRGVGGIDIWEQGEACGCLRRCEASILRDVFFCRYPFGFFFGFWIFFWCSGFGFGSGKLKPPVAMVEMGMGLGSAWVLLFGED